MKNIIFALLPVLFLVASCENKDQTARISQLENEQAQLVQDATSKDSLINSFLETLNLIEANLAEIKTKEKIISQETGSGNELNKPARERINEDIRTINELMANNKKMISSLNDKLRNSKLKVSELDKMIESTNLLLAERDTEIETLKSELTNLNFSIATLNDTISRIKNRNQELATTVVNKNNELNVAYFVVGPRKELIEKKILNKEGGFLGLGRTQTLAGDVNLADFTKIDMRSLKSIPLGVKKATLMSVHPAGSYEIIGTDKKVEEIIIKDPAAFWQKSKMLVISTEA
jgi:myosin heavy subunit